MLPPLQTVVDEKAQRNGHSVTATGEGSPMFDTPSAISSLFFPIGAFADIVPAWSYYPTVRDKFLRTFYKSESHFASATYSMTAFAKTLNLTLNGLPRAKSYAQDILNDCQNGMGYRNLIELSAVDLFTTDNGTFWELIGSGRADKPLKGKLLPPYVMHLDSLQCWRTMDPEFPVVYVNPLKNTFHKLHYTRVIFRSNMPQPDELARGVGYCAASRILRYAQLMRDQLIYRHEKISGQFTRAIGFLKGINAVELAAADTSARESAKSAGFGVYRGIPFLGKAGIETGAEILDLATLYDGFDIEKETTLYMFATALAYGVDAREFWPATASGATKADASIQDMKTQGKGKGDTIETFTSMWHGVFPDSVEGVYDNTDDEQDFQRAKIWQVHQQTYSGLVKDTVIDQDEARAHLVKEGVLDTALLKASAPATMQAENVEDTTPEQDVEGKPATGEKPDTDDPSEEKNPIAQQEAKGLKELSATREDFFSAVSNVFEGAIDKSYSRAQFERQLYRLIRRYGERAYRDGLADGGVELDASEPLDREDMAALNKLIGEQTGYIGNVGDVLFNEDVSDDITVNKPEMWWNKSVIPFYQAGLLSANGNGMYEWVVGKAEHCSTCLTMNGQVHRMREYSERGITPQASSLECGGYRCACSLKKTSGRAKGRWV